MKTLNQDNVVDLETFKALKRATAVLNDAVPGCEMDDYEITDEGLVIKPTGVVCYEPVINGGLAKVLAFRSR